MKPALLVLAAGMGSRYGGLKQLDGVGPCGETIMDYSVFDAARAGFGKVVFVIRKFFREEFEKQIVSKYKDLIEVELEKNGVDTGCIVRTSENPTPVTTIFVAEDGNRKSITNKAHSYNFHPEQYPERFTDTKAVVIGSLFRAPFNDPDVIRAVVSEVHSRGIPVFADTKIPNFRRLTLDDIADSLSMIDYITPNEDEAKFFTGEEEPEKMAAAFLEKGVKNVVLKLGGRGCLLMNSRETIYVPSYKIKVVDATGAGDNFMAGLVSELIRGSNVRDALEFANACGAICTTAVGTGTALKNREQVLRMLSTQNK
jgi:sugar/nucleoside kinase (ribokinase family)